MQNVELNGTMIFTFLGVVQSRLPVLVDVPSLGEHSLGEDSSPGSHRLRLRRRGIRPLLTFLRPQLYFLKFSQYY